MGRYWITRLIYQRGLAVIYLIAFLVALNQFPALLGEHGLLPARLFVRQVSFAQSPSLFFFLPTEVAFRTAAWLGIILSVTAVTGLSERYSNWLSASVWALLWILYLSFVNVGQTFYAFGWESILLEAGFFAIFLGARKTEPSWIMMLILRWVLFRVMFGAELIKLRGDPCWRDLTCLNYHYETQPMPGPLSWYFHWSPEWTHKGGVLFNHFAELVVPFGYFGPQRAATVAGLCTILFHVVLMATGNLSWLNLLTIVLAFSALNDTFLSRVLRVNVIEIHELPRFQRVAVAAVAALTALLSVPPILNMLSRQQVMNANYNPFHLVNTYGAFGGITRTRFEVIVEGTEDMAVSESTRWREYEFKGKPGDPTRRPPQIAPYHLRLDWLMWFAAMSSYDQEPWFVHFVAQLLHGDLATLALIRTNPFPDRPPHFIRALLYEYHFTTPRERKETGRWWVRRLNGTYFPSMSLDNPAFRQLLKQEGWM